MVKRGMVKRGYEIRNAAEMERFGFALSAIMRAGLIICLAGDLGAGKSTLARGMIKGGCTDVDDIPSPTFTLIQTYETGKDFEIWHMDFYRLNWCKQAQGLGIEDALFEACCLIEWPDRIEDMLPKAHENRVEISINFADQLDKRYLTIAAAISLNMPLEARGFKLVG